MIESAAKQAAELVQEQGGRMKAELGGVVVLDFGGQYTQLIARRIREQQVFSAVLPCSSSIEEIRKLEPAGIVLSGGPSSVYDAEAPKCDPKVLALGIPVLGICYGMQWITHTLGGTVEKAERREYGRAHLKVEGQGQTEKSELFAGVPESLRIWNSHGVGGGSRAKDLRSAIPRGSEPHRARNRDAAKFSVSRVPSGAEVERGGLYRGDDGGDPREGGK